MKILFIGARLFDEVANYARSQGITTILSESNPESPNLKLADEYHIVPRGMDYPMDLALSKDVDAVVPLIGIDKPLIEVARMKEKLEKEYELPVIASGLKAAEISTNKVETKDFLRKIDVRTPEFTEISKEEYDSSKYLTSKPLLKFPTVLKQGEGQGGVGVKVARTTEDADAYFQTFSHAMVEDFLKGIEISVEVLRWNDESVPLVGIDKGDTTLECTHPLNKIRTAPVNLANLDKQELLKIAAKITDELGASGTTEVEFIFDEKTQQLNALEINTRPSGTRFLTLSSSNINTMHQLVNMATGEWNPHRIKREIKEYAALEVPLPLKETSSGNKPESRNKSFQIQRTNSGLERYIFVQNKPWIIHGPEKASRVTVRAKTADQSLKIVKDLKIVKKFDK